MDLVIVFFWFIVFIVIVLFLGALNYFLGRPTSTVKVSEKPQSDTTNQQQPITRSNPSSNRRRHARNEKRKRQQTIAINDNLNSDNNEDKPIVIPEIKAEEEEESVVESSVKQSDEEQEQTEEFEDAIETEEVSTPAPSLPSSPAPSPVLIQEEPEPTLPVKQRNKTKSNNTNSKATTFSTSVTINPSVVTSTISSKEETTLPTKPKASVVPVKQSLPSILKDQSTRTVESTQIQQNNHFKSNGNLSSYAYSGQNSLPPRFQQQRQQDSSAVQQKFRKRRHRIQPKQFSIPPDSAARQNDFIPLTSNQQINNNNQLLPPGQQETSSNNGYSSESDIQSESVSTACNNNHPPSSLLSTSTHSQMSLKGLDLLRSLSSSNILLDGLVSIFDTVSFSSDELELILNKISSKNLLNKQDYHHLLSLKKSDKTIERILDETYHSQVKIFAIELQTEKNRVLELTKTNADMENMIRQLQQQQQQQPNNMAQYQQTILSYQMQLRRITDENARCVHQLHAYSMMPSSINELKQQQQILNEQIRQMTIQNSALEKEIADGERASKQAAEIYKKGDAQKQDRIEQMSTDINKYQKFDRELINLREKNAELEKNLTAKITNITHQRDQLEKSCEQLKEKIQEYEQIKFKYDQFIQTQEHEQIKNPNVDQLQQEILEVKAKNDVLRQRNWKIMEQLNKLSNEQNQSS